MCIHFKYVASHSLQINVKDVPGICNLEKSFFDDNDFNRKNCSYPFHFGILYLVS